MTSSIASLSVSVLGSVLTLLSAYYTFHPHAYPVLKNLFENERWKRLCGYISSVMGRSGGGSSNDVVLATLRLLTVIVERWDGKKVLDGFVWEVKARLSIYERSMQNLRASLEPRQAPSNAP